MNFYKSLKEIAQVVQGELISSGDGDLPIYGGCSLENAKEGYITFFSDVHYLKYLENTKATAILVSKKLDQSIPQLVVPNPKLAFSKVLSLFSLFPKLPSGVNPQVVKEEGVILGSDLSIGPFVYLGKGARMGDRVIVYPGVFVGAEVTVGDDCVIYPNVTLYPSVCLGKRVIVHAGTVLGGDGFGYVFDGKAHVKIPQVGGLMVEDDVEIGANSAIDRGMVDVTRVGQGTKIDNLVQVGHNCLIGSANILCGQVGLSGCVETGKGVMFGGQSGAGDHSVIPDGVQLAAQSGVMKNMKLESHEAYFGSPAKKIRDSFKILSILYKLPDLYKRLKLLEKKVSQLLDKRP